MARTSGEVLLDSLSLVGGLGEVDREATTRGNDRASIRLAGHLGVSILRTHGGTNGGHEGDVGGVLGEETAERTR